MKAGASEISFRARDIGEEPARCCAPCSARWASAHRNSVDLARFQHVAQRAIDGNQLERQLAGRARSISWSGAAGLVDAALEHVMPEIDPVIMLQGCRAPTAGRLAVFLNADLFASRSRARSPGFLLIICYPWRKTPRERPGSRRWKVAARADQIMGQHISATSKECVLVMRAKISGEDWIASSAGEIPRAARACAKASMRS